MSMRRTEGGMEGAEPGSGHERDLAVLLPRKSADMDSAKLAYDTKRRLSLAGPGRAQGGGRGAAGR